MVVVAIWATVRTNLDERVSATVFQEKFSSQLMVGFSIRIRPGEMWLCL
jgi:hypothetical protein